MLVCASCTKGCDASDGGSSMPAFAAIPLSLRRNLLVSVRNSFWQYAQPPDQRHRSRRSAHHLEESGRRVRATRLDKPVYQMPLNPGCAGRCVADRAGPGDRSLKLSQSIFPLNSSCIRPHRKTSMTFIQVQYPFLPTWSYSASRCF